MISEKELLKAIEDCERNLNSLQGCEKLSALYNVYDHLYGAPAMYENVHVTTETVVKTDKDNEFFKAVDGKEAGQIWNIINELMESVKLIQPRLYDATIQKIKDV